MIKCLDSDKDEFFNCFVKKEIYDSLAGTPKHTAVSVTLDWTAGTKYFETLGIDIIKK